MTENKIIFWSLRAGLSQVRWPAPDGGSSFGWRLTFWLLFCQEKSNREKNFVSLQKIFENFKYHE